MYSISKADPPGAGLVALEYIHHTWLMVQGLRLRVYGLGLRVDGVLEAKVQGLWGWGPGFRV